MLRAVIGPRVSGVRLWVEADVASGQGLGAGRTFIGETEERKGERFLSSFRGRWVEGKAVSPPCTMGVM